MVLIVTGGCGRFFAIVLTSSGRRGVRGFEESGRDSSMTKNIELKEDEEEAEGTVHELGDGGDKVRIISIIYMRVLFGVLLLGYFFSIGPSSKNSYPSLPYSLGARQINYFFKRNMGGKQKFIQPQQD